MYLSMVKELFTGWDPEAENKGVKGPGEETQRFFMSRLRTWKQRDVHRHRTWQVFSFLHRNGSTCDEDVPLFSPLLPYLLAFRPLHFCLLVHSVSQMPCPQGPRGSVLMRFVSPLLPHTGSHTGRLPPWTRLAQSVEGYGPFPKEVHWLKIVKAFFSPSR